MLIRKSKKRYNVFCALAALCAARRLDPEHEKQRPVSDLVHAKRTAGRKQRAGRLLSFGAQQLLHQARPAASLQHQQRGHPSKDQRVPLSDAQLARIAASAASEGAWAQGLLAGKRCKEAAVLGCVQRA